MSVSSKSQPTPALSSSEAEYYATSAATQEALFIQMILKELLGEDKVKVPAMIYNDNMGSIFLVNNQQMSTRTKHIDIKHHFIRHHQEEGNTSVKFIRSDIRSYD